MEKKIAVVKEGDICQIVYDLMTDEENNLSHLVKEIPVMVLLLGVVAVDIERKLLGGDDGRA